jgi:DNA-binding PadR family transcriptional regulator
MVAAARYSISQAIRLGSGEVHQVERGSLYPALHRPEREAWITSVSDNNQRVNAYELTAAGKRQLAAERSRGELLVHAISGVLKLAGN